MPPSVLYAALLDDDVIKIYTRDGHTVTLFGSVACSGGPMWLAVNPSKTMVYACTLKSSELVRLVLFSHPHVHPATPCTPSPWLSSDKSASASFSQMGPSNSHLESSLPDRCIERKRDAYTLQAPRCAMHFTQCMHHHSMCSCCSEVHVVGSLT